MKTLLEIVRIKNHWFNYILTRGIIHFNIIILHTNTRSLSPSLFFYLLFECGKTKNVTLKAIKALTKDYFNGILK